MDNKELLEKLDSIFEFFQQITEKEIPRFKGTGLDGPFNAISMSCDSARKLIADNKG